jgi:predicted HTH transcriptional regulator
LAFVENEDICNLFAVKCHSLYSVEEERVVLKRPDIGGVRAASATTRKTTRKTTSYTTRKTTSKVPLKSALETAFEGLTGNARKIMQVISEDPGITIESLATLVKLTPDGIRYHLKALAKSVGLRHSSDRKGGVWNVPGTVNTNREVSPKTSPKIAPKTSPKRKRAANAEKVLSIVRDNPGVTARQIAELIGVSQRTVRMYIKDLRSAGLRYEGSAKTGRWVINPAAKKKGGPA